MFVNVMLNTTLLIIKYVHHVNKIVLLVTLVILVYFVKVKILNKILLMEVNVNVKVGFIKRQTLLVANLKVHNQ